jgi:hypothetical protein
MAEKRYVRVLIENDTKQYKLPASCLVEVGIFNKKAVKNMTLRNDPSVAFMLPKYVTKVALDCMTRWYEVPMARRTVADIVGALKQHAKSIGPKPDFIFRSPDGTIEVRSQQPIVQHACKVWTICRKLGADDLVRELARLLQLFAKENYFMSDVDGISVKFRGVRQTPFAC